METNAVVKSALDVVFKTNAELYAKRGCQSRIGFGQQTVFISMLSIDERRGCAGHLVLALSKKV
jgi:hypothetical protein